MKVDLLDRLIDRMRACGIEASTDDAKLWRPGELNYFRGRFNKSKRKSSYVLYRGDGDSIIGYFGDFHADFGDRSEVFYIGPDEGDSKVDDAERRRRRAATDLAQKEAEQDRANRKRLAAQRAAEIYAAGRPAEDGHDYTARKRIHPSGLTILHADAVREIIHYSPRQDDEKLEGDLLVVPLFDAEGALVNVEMIDAKGRKASLYGGPRAGVFWCAGSLTAEPPVIGLAEGMATSQTLHELGGIPIVSVGGCHNFAPLLETLSRLLPSSRMIVFSDLGNGAIHAQKAAARFSATVLLPPAGIEGTDFNDLLVERGDQAVIEAIHPAIQAAQPGDQDALDDAKSMLFLPRSAMTRPDLDFVIPGLLAGSVGLLVGQGSIGKSFLVKQLALSLAFGEVLPWDVGNPSATPVRAGKVGVLFGEDETPIIQSRYYDIFEATPRYKSEEYLALMERNLRIYGLPGEDMRIMEDVRGELLPGPFLARLDRFCEKKRIVFIDPLGKLMDGNENDNRMATRMMEKLVLIGQRTRCAIIVLHHVSKGGAGEREDWTAARGAGAITATARFQMNMRPFSEAECSAAGISPDDRSAYVHIGVAKVNYGARPAPFMMRRGPGGVLLPFFNERAKASSFDSVFGDTPGPSKRQRPTGGFSSRDD